VSAKASRRKRVFSSRTEPCARCFGSTQRVRGIASSFPRRETYHGNAFSIGVAARVREETFPLQELAAAARGHGVRRYYLLIPDRRADGTRQRSIRKSGIECGEHALGHSDRRQYPVHDTCFGMEQKPLFYSIGPYSFRAKTKSALAIDLATRRS